MTFFTITITALLSVALTATTTTATITAAALPHQHRARFLAEFDTIALELVAWKNSPAGRYAKANNLFKPASPLNITSISLVTDDQILRFFFSKLAAEAAQLKNPDATFGTNSPFSLMSEAEFAKYVSKSSTLGKDGGLLRGFGGEATSAPDANNSTDVVGASRTRSMDWGKSGCVAGVKNQGWCGSCWAFAAVGALESAYCLKYGSLTRFSEQQVTSCDSTSYGCDGGWPSRALSYVRTNGGLCTSSAYPYSSGSSGETGTCDSSLCTVTPLTITAIKGVAASDAGFVAAINRQPVAVTVAAGNPTWKQYTGGIVSECETTAEDHAVLVVGYDATTFRLKNQWGTAWGAGGYIKLKRRSSTEAACGLINKNAVYPVVA